MKRHKHLFSRLNPFFPGICSPFSQETDSSRRDTWNSSDRYRLDPVYNNFSISLKTPVQQLYELAQGNLPSIKDISLANSGFKKSGSGRE